MVDISRTRSLSAFTLFRVAFGVVWLLDGLMKFVWLQPSNVLGLVSGAGQGQPDWLQGWFSFWSHAVSSNPSAFLYGVGTLELALAFALILGFMRKPAYLGGIILSLSIWAIDEGFGGPYGAGSTDIGAAIMYVFIFAALVLMERAIRQNQCTLDSMIERRWKSWKRLSDF